MDYHYGDVKSILNIMFTLLCIPYITRTEVDVRYIGCYALSSEWQHVNYYDHLTGEMCIQACFNREYTFAAFVYYGCWCSQTLSGNSSELCMHINLDCPGGGTLRCTTPLICNVYEAVPKNNDFLGCFTDSTNQYAMPWWPYADNPGLTADICIHDCTDRGRNYKFAGLQEIYERGSRKFACFCSNFRYDIYGKSDHCDAPCPGDEDDVCGGHDGRTLSVYRTGAEPTIPGFIDCFDDNPRPLATFIGANFTTVSDCALKCLQGGYNYTGMKEDDECYCGNTVDSYEAVLHEVDQCYCGNTVDSYQAVLGDDKPSCSLPCEGNPDQYCGRSGRRWMAVYSSDDYKPTMAMEPTTSQQMTLDQTGNNPPFDGSDGKDTDDRSTYDRSTDGRSTDGQSSDGQSMNVPARGVHIGVVLGTVGALLCVIVALAVIAGCLWRKRIRHVKVHENKHQADEVRTEPLAQVEITETTEHPYEEVKDYEYVGNGEIINQTVLNDKGATYENQGFGSEETLEQNSLAAEYYYTSEKGGNEQIYQRTSDQLDKEDGIYIVEVYTPLKHNYLENNQSI